MGWDAIVVGSGLGGMTAAAYLTANGRRTLVLEQDDTVGGFTQVFRRKKQWEFDVGVHYVGWCGPGEDVPTVLHGLGIDDRIEWRQLDPDAFTTLVFPDFEFRIPAGWENYRERMLETFPEEAGKLGRCLKIMERMGHEVYREGARRVQQFPLRAPVTAGLGMMTNQRWFDMWGLSEKARAVICGEHGDYSSPPSRLPLAVQSGFMQYYLKSGGWYPQGGGQVLAANLLDVIQSHGGAVRTKARVDRILVEGGRVMGVKLEDGEVIRAPVVISNADIKRTVFELVGKEHWRRRTVKWVGDYRMALPLTPVYLGLNIDGEELQRRMGGSTQFWAHTHYDIERGYQRMYRGEMDRDFALYVTSTTLKDPNNPHVAPPGCSNVILMAVMPGEREFWKVERGPAEGEKYSKDEEYRALKEEFKQALVDRADELIPGLKESIIWEEASTGVTNERYTLSSDGTCYGPEAAVDQFAWRRLPPKTEVRGLYLAGQGTVWCMGVANTMNSGVDAAATVIGRDLRRETQEGKVFADRSRLPEHGEDWDPLMACRRLSKKPRSHKRKKGRDADAAQNGAAASRNGDGAARDGEVTHERETALT